MWHFDKVEEQMHPIYPRIQYEQLPCPICTPIYSDFLLTFRALTLLKSQGQNLKMFVNKKRYETMKIVLGTTPGVVANIYDFEIQGGAISKFALLYCG